MTEQSKHQRRARYIRVYSWQDLSPNLRRVVFHSEDLADYPFRCKGAHIKIFLPKAGQNRPQLPVFSPAGPVWADAQNRPVSRTYTLRDFDSAASTLTIDWVKHGDNGPATHFVENVCEGQVIGVSEPAGPVPMLKPAARYVMVGDLSALPAICAMLEDAAQKQPEACGDVFLLLPEQADQAAVPSAPPGFRFHVFFGGVAQHQKLIDAVQLVEKPQPQDFVWLAGEAGLVQPLRTLARQAWQMPVQRCYAVPYWRFGENEESYHRKRHDFMDNNV